MTATDSPVIVALDVAEASAALALAHRLDPTCCRLKVGKELFTACGPAVVEDLQRLGFQVFLDLKFHDIPNTVAAAVRSAANLGVWMVNVHASGGPRMLAAAQEAAESGPLLIGVTVLTSMDGDDYEAVGYRDPLAEQVPRLARLCQARGLSGVVCSAEEAPALRAACGDDFLLVTPGIRPAGSDNDDQRRVLTPDAALRAGADYLVIGRPITRAADPESALAAINASIKTAATG